MKKLSTFIIPALLIASTSAFASLDLHFATEQDATWVKVTDNGQPVANATITTDYTGDNEFITDEEGKTYIFINALHSSSVDFTAVDMKGQTVSKKHYIKEEK
ncbi:hypothetical protein [Photobacterium sp. DNB22_13_2]